MFGVLYNQGNALLYPFFVRYVLEEEGGLSLFFGNQTRRIIPARFSQVCFKHFCIPESPFTLPTAKSFTELIPTSQKFTPVDSHNQYMHIHICTFKNPNQHTVHTPIVYPNKKRHRRNPQVESSKKYPFKLEMESSVQNRLKLRLLGLYILLGGFFVPFWAMASKRFDKRHTLAIATSIQRLGADLKVVLFWKEMICASSITLVHVHRHCSSEEEEEEETLFYHTLCFQLQVTPSLKTKWWVAPKALRAVALLVAFLAVSPGAIGIYSGVIVLAGQSTCRGQENTTPRCWQKIWTLFMFLFVVFWWYVHLKFMSFLHFKPCALLKVI